MYSTLDNALKYCQCTDWRLACSSNRGISIFSTVSFLRTKLLLDQSMLTFPPWVSVSSKDKSYRQGYEVIDKLRSFYFYFFFLFSVKQSILESLIILCSQNLGNVKAIFLYLLFKEHSKHHQNVIITVYSKSQSLHWRTGCAHCLPSQHVIWVRNWYKIVCHVIIRD